MAWAPVLAANLRTARWPYVLDEITQTSFGFSTAAMTRAAKTSFSQVFPMLIMWMPRHQVYIENMYSVWRCTHHRPFVSRHKVPFAYRSFCRQCDIGRLAEAESLHRSRSGRREVLRTSAKERSPGSASGPPTVTASHPSTKPNNPGLQEVLVCT